MTDDLVQRLRTIPDRAIFVKGGLVYEDYEDVMEAADRIEALEEDIERLREALKRIQHFSPAHMWRAPDIKVIISAALQEQSK